MEQEQSAFIVLRAIRKTDKLRSDVFFSTSSEKKKNTNSNPFDDFVGSIVETLSKNELDESSKSHDHVVCRTAVAINSMLILYWKVRYFYFSFTTI